MWTLHWQSSYFFKARAVQTYSHDFVGSLIFCEIPLPILNLYTVKLFFINLTLAEPVRFTFLLESVLDIAIFKSLIMHYLHQIEKYI